MRILTTTTLSLAVAALSASALPAQDGVQPGDKPEYTWRSELFNGMGASSLADFRGKPVLIDFWGTK